MVSRSAVRSISAIDVREGGGGGGVGSPGWAFSFAMDRESLQGRLNGTDGAAEPHYIICYAYGKMCL